MTVRPAKTQISLGIRPVWSESSLCAQWVAKDFSFLHADSENSDQTGRMPRLTWVFTGRTTTLLVLSSGGSNVFLMKFLSLLYRFHDSILPFFCHLSLNNLIYRLTLVSQKLISQPLSFIHHEPCHEKTCLRGFATQDSNRPAQLQSLARVLKFWIYKSISIILFRQRTTKALIRLRECAGWSASLLFAYRFCHDVDL